MWYEIWYGGRPAMPARPLFMSITITVSPLSSLNPCKYL